MTQQKKILIVSAGNTLMKDDGLGWVVLQNLRKIVKCENIHFFDTATDIFKLMNLQEEFDKIIILDAIQSGNEPGTIYRLNLDDVPSINTNKSVHQIKITEALKLLRITNSNFEKSEFILYGIEPYDVSIGEGITPIVNKSIKYLVDLVYAELENARSFDCKKYN